MAAYKTHVGRRNKRKSSESRSNRLPIDSFKDDLVSAVQDNQFLVVVGETGSGKTTQLPQYLYEAGMSDGAKMIGITQPRRIAAITVAQRVAEERNTKIGGLVGYQVRFDDCTSQETCIKFMTDGCLLREFLDDTHLSRYSIIILDEAHERSLDTDILFGLVKKFFIKRKEKCPKIVVMSATLNHQKFSEFLNECPVIEIPGKVFPVEKLFCDYVGKDDLKSPNYLTKVVETVMAIHLEYPPGDILVFLTGQEEIEKCCDRLFVKAEEIDYDHDIHSDVVEAILILPLYGSMATDLQRKVFDPPDSSIRKVVVATNIATTSLTIDGIKYVVDSGFVKQLSFNPRTGLDSLNVVLISRSEAIQRCGRAGRTSKGTCFRMYSREVYEESMNEETIPEIQRTSLARVVLHLKCMGINDVIRFQYIDPPEERMILEALKQLYYFGAVSSKGHVTSLGHRMVELPLAPGLSCAVINSANIGCDDLVLPVAAMLSVENVFVSYGGKSKSAQASQVHSEIAELAGGTNDFATLLYIYKECMESESSAKWCRERFIHWRAVKMAFTVHQQLKNIIEKQKCRWPSNQPGKALPQSERGSLRQALCAGYFCNVARRGSSGSGFRTMDGHGTIVHIHPSSTLFGCEEQLDWIIYHDIIWTSKIYVRYVCPIRYEWVKDLLPRLHKVDAYTLSGWSFDDCNTMASQSCTVNDAIDTEEDQCEQENAVPSLTLSKRNSDDTIKAARQRYLQRKRARVDGT